MVLINEAAALASKMLTFGRFWTLLILNCTVLGNVEASMSDSRVII